MWTMKPTYCVFSVQKQLPYSNFIKHFEEMEENVIQKVIS